MPLYTRKGISFRSLGSPMFSITVKEVTPKTKAMGIPASSKPKNNMAMKGEIAVPPVETLSDRRSYVLMLNGDVALPHSITSTST